MRKRGDRGAHMEAAADVAIAAQLDEDLLVEGEADEIKRLVDDARLWQDAAAVGRAGGGRGRHRGVWRTMMTFYEVGG